MTTVQAQRALLGWIGEFAKGIGELNAAGIKFKALGDARIVELVGRGKTPASAVDASFDASRHVILPGLVNAQIRMRVSRSNRIANGLPFVLRCCRFDAVTVDLCRPGHGAKPLPSVPVVTGDGRKNLRHGLAEPGHAQRAARGAHAAAPRSGCTSALAMRCHVRLSAWDITIVGRMRATSRYARS